MKALLVMAHGTPRAEANVDVLRVAEAVRERNAYPFVHVCYLDCNEPDIATGVDQCVAAGANEIVAVPYFLHSGRHLLRDIPAILEDAVQRHPGLSVAMGDYVGHMSAMSDVLRDRVREANQEPAR
jgi:sirohydrochlorin ferrochelatase